MPAVHAGSTEHAGQYSRRTLTLLLHLSAALEIELPRRFVAKRGSGTTLAQVGTDLQGCGAVRAGVSRFPGRFCALNGAVQALGFASERPALG